MDASFPPRVERPALDIREATISSIHQMLFSGSYTCREVVAAFLARMEVLNSKINAIICLNENVLSDADALDRRLATNEPCGLLFGVPILLKDNFDTADMRTTGGCAALYDMQPSVDAPVVAALRAAGALILGKVNMHELALEGLSVSSLGGQTINPYDFSRTPGGSSGGSGAAIAASFAVLATGTDTVNSLRSPTSANSLFSIRPTRGLLSRSGVIPISHTQDAVGMIGRCVSDIATSLTVMASVGEDLEDSATTTCPIGKREKDYHTKLGGANLQDVRLGVVSTFFNRIMGSEATPVNNVVDGLLRRLESAGAELITIKQPIYTSTEIIHTCDTQRYEYRDALDAYLARPSLGGRRPANMIGLYTGSSVDARSFLVIPGQYDYIQKALVASTRDGEYEQIQAHIRDLTRTLHCTFEDNRLDALIYPQQQNLVVKIGSASQSGRNGILAAVTGSPVVTVPAGFSDPSQDAPRGVPIGVELLGRPWSERRLLDIAGAIEMLGSVRKPPEWAEEMIEGKEYSVVPKMEANHLNVDQCAYPLGRIK